jgi:hypothetical protein
VPKIKLVKNHIPGIKAALEPALSPRITFLHYAKFEHKDRIERLNQLYVSERFSTEKCKLQEICFNNGDVKTYLQQQQGRIRIRSFFFNGA